MFLPLGLRLLSGLFFFHALRVCATLQGGASKFMLTVGLASCIDLAERLNREVFTLRSCSGLTKAATALAFDVLFVHVALVDGMGHL